MGLKSLAARSDLMRLWAQGGKAIGTMLSQATSQRAAQGWARPGYEEDAVPEDLTNQGLQAAVQAPRTDRRKAVLAPRTVARSCMRDTAQAGADGRVVMVKPVMRIRTPEAPS